MSKHSYKGRPHAYAKALCREPRPEDTKLIDRDFGAWLAQLSPEELDAPGEYWVNPSVGWQEE